MNVSDEKHQPLIDNLKLPENVNSQIHAGDVFLAISSIEEIILEAPELLIDERYAELNVLSRVVDLLINLYQLLQSEKVDLSKRKYDITGLLAVLQESVNQLIYLLNSKQFSIPIKLDNLSRQLDDRVGTVEAVNFNDEEQITADEAVVDPGYRTAEQAGADQQMLDQMRQRLGRVFEEGMIGDVIRFARSEKREVVDVALEYLAHQALTNLINENGWISLKEALLESYEEFKTMLDLVIGIYIGSFQHKQDKLLFINHIFNIIDTTATNVINQYYDPKKAFHTQWLDAPTWRDALKAKWLRQIEQEG